MATGRRTDCLQWDEAFMNMAKVIAKRSKDPRTQVGAVLVSKDHRVLSLGYNGAPRGLDDDTEMPWTSDPDDPMLDKHYFVVHAERNCVLNYRGSLADLHGATLYVTLYPCYECAKELAQVEVGGIVYLERRESDKESNRISDYIIGHAGMTTRRYDGRIILDGAPTD